MTTQSHSFSTSSCSARVSRPRRNRHNGAPSAPQILSLPASLVYEGYVDIKFERHGASRPVSFIEFGTSGSRLATPNRMSHGTGGLAPCRSNCHPTEGLQSSSALSGAISTPGKKRPPVTRFGGVGRPRRTGNAPICQ